MTVPDRLAIEGGEVVGVVDACGPFGLGSLAETFVGGDADDWDRARELDPAAFLPAGGWHLAFRCFLVRLRGVIVLVDTGVGPADAPASSWAPTPGALPSALADLGVDMDDVDIVVQTHLHSDHVGWSVTATGRPVFPSARYVVQHQEVRALDRARSPLVDSVVRPLRDAGQLQLVEGETLLAAPTGARVTAVPTPGHTPGHQSVLVGSGRHQVLVTGDVAVHAVQLVNPDVGYAHESDPPVAARTRRLLLDRLAGTRTVLATSHVNRPFIDVDGHLPG